MENEDSKWILYTVISGVMHFWGGTSWGGGGGSSCDTHQPQKHFFFFFFYIPKRINYIMKYIDSHFYVSWSIAGFLKSFPGAPTLIKLTTCDFLMILKTLISMLRCVWLELNSAGVGQI